MADEKPSLEDRLRDEWVPTDVRLPNDVLETIRRSTREAAQHARPRPLARLPWFAAAGLALAAVGLLATGRLPDASSPGPSPATTAPVTSIPPSGSPEDQNVGLPGTWVPTAVPPIGGRSGHVLVWTGREALVWGGMESNKQRTVFDGYLPNGGAAYDPGRDTWRTIPAAPIEGRGFPLAAWTGTELLVWGGHGAGRERLDGAAYNPATDTWRLLPPVPLERGDAVGGWLDRRFVVVTSDGAAAYDPRRDTWDAVEAAPVRPEWRYAAIVGDLLIVIAYGDGATGIVEGAILGPAGQWEPIDVPLEPLDAGIQPLSGGELVLLPDAGKALDPAKATWRPISACRGAANGATWTGRYLIGVGAAYEPVTDRCLELPPSPNRAAPFDATNGREFAVGVWMGDRYLTWSGGNGGDIVWVPNDGAVFLPAEQPSATARPSVAPTPMPTPPLDLPTSLVHEDGGARITVQLERNPLVAGESSWATLEVTNTGADDLVWFHDGCAIPVRLWGEMSGDSWRPGVEHTGLAGEFKRRALEHHGIADGRVLVDFVPEPYVGMGSFGCTDIGLTDYIKPGSSIQQRAQWNGMAARRLGSPPAGRITLTVNARYYWRSGEPEPADITTRTLSFELPGWVESSRDASWLDPAEVVDAAVGQQEFIDRIASRMPSGHDFVLQFDPESGVWEVGLLGFDRRQYYLALVDPRSGDVLDIVERPWNPEVDGWP